jgi:hypothetical protein
MESKVVEEWTTQARAEGEGKEAAGLLLQMLKDRFKQVPDDLRAAMQDVKEIERLKGWGRIALEARSLRLFRQQVGL